MKYDEHDLLWLFECEPKILNDDGYDGIVSYCKSLNNFELSIMFDIYENWGLVCLSYLSKCVFTAELEGITSLLKYGKSLIISVEREPFLELIFADQLSVELISQEERARYKEVLSQ